MMTQQEAARLWLQHLQDWLSAPPNSAASLSAQCAMNGLWRAFHLETVKVRDLVPRRDATRLVRLARLARG